jgi:hypothetical protein
MAAAVSEEPVDPADELMFLALGGGNEVGRSCHIIQYKGKTVMVRCHHITLTRPRPHPRSRHQRLQAVLTDERAVTARCRPAPGL